MSQKIYHWFTKLCESYIQEDSTTIDLVGKYPGGEKIAKLMHRELGLSHDQQYKQVPKITWSTIKSSYTRNLHWILVQGSNSIGAVRGTRDGYEVWAYNTQRKTPDHIYTNSGGEVLAFLKERIGRIEKFYLGADTGEYDKKIKQRQLTRLNKDKTVEVDTILEKLRPLWVKSIDAAIADVKGMATNMIKNNAIGKAQKKLSQALNLQKALDKIENGESSEFIHERVAFAILMAASYYYPEKTGEITKSYRGYSVESSEGRNQLLNDIASGDYNKLGTVLAFLRKGLILE